MAKLKIFVFFAAIFLIPTLNWAGQYYDGRSGAKANRTVVLNKIHPGQIILISELHGYEPHHQNQRDLLVEMSSTSRPIYVGMELFSYPNQTLVDQFGLGKIREADFIKSISWKGTDFTNYKFQVLLPYYHGGQTLALNLPRSITNQVAQKGLDSLSEEQQSLLPPNFSIGSNSLFQRFKERMQDHIPKENLEKYFVAHSLWDDTMAWQASEHVQRHPDSFLFIIVGDFHVAYQDGLIARLKARGVENILSISQINTEGLTEEQKRKEILPDPQYGARADFVFAAE